MARTPRIWSDIDIAMVNYFTELRAQDDDSSLRSLAARSGLKHTRLGDLFNMQNGTPTLQEFIDLCILFGVDPSGSLKIILDRVEYERQGLIGDVADRPENYDIAALHDSSKRLEREGGDGR
jgi:transcriptional regulator with XRE-family HTH domain